MVTSGLDVETVLDDLFDGTSKTALRAGEVLLEPGARRAGLVRLSRGLMWVDAADDRSPVLRVLGAGAVFGELAALTRSPHTARVTARTDCVVQVLTADLVEERLAEDASLARALGVRAARLLAPIGDLAVPHIGGWLDPAGLQRGLRQAVRDALHDTVWLEVSDLDEDGIVEALLAALAAGSPVVLDATDAPAAGVSAVARHADTLLDARAAHPGVTLAPFALRARLVQDVASSGVVPGQETYFTGTPPTQLVPALVRLLRGAGELGRALEGSLGPLSPEARTLAERHADPVSLRAQQVVWHQGDPADELICIRSGALDVLVDGTRVLRAGPGAVLGERTWLTRDARAATVVAARDTTVARLSFDAVDALASRWPGIAVALGRSAAERLTSDASPTPDKTTICVLRLDAEAPAVAVRGALCDALGAPFLDADRVARTLGVEPAEVRADTPTLDGWIREVVARTEDAHGALVLDGGAPSTPWARRCARQADRVVLVARGAEEPRELPHLQDSPEAHLVLSWEGSPEGTVRWLDALPAARWHHLLPDDDGASLAALARRITGTGVGLAFAGASFRGMGHLGVLEALHHRGYPIDALAGSSSGATIAVLVGAGLPLDEAVRRSVALTAGFDPGVRRLTPPLTALRSGRQVSSLLRTMFGDLRLEDLPIPARITATDLNRRQLVVLDRGPAWLACRASGSLPGLFPPVAVDGNVLVDGALLNNAPLDLLSDSCSTRILSEMLAVREERFPYVDAYGAHLDGWRALGRRLGVARAPRAPSALAVLMESVMVANAAQRRHAVNQPGILSVRARVTTSGMFSIRTFEQAKAAIAEAREGALEQIPAWG